MSPPTVVRITDRSSVAELRRAAGACARTLGWSDTACGESELVATEVATNLVKHARDGVVSLATDREAPGGSLLVVAVDRGPGMADVARSFADGFSTSGSPGTGLGAIRRLAHAIDVQSAPHGTVLVAELRDRPSAGAERAQPSVRLAGFAVPKDGQVVNGDAWAHRWVDRRLEIIACDGLGHGYEAQRSASRAIECFEAGGWDTPKQFLELANEALRATRGAAVAVAQIDTRERRVRFGGVGNVVAGIVGADGRAHHLVSHNGILGTAPRLAEFEYAWPRGAILIMHSDGLSSRWPLERWHGIWSRHPALIAGTLYRDLARGTDDAAVVVALEDAAAA
jgi:anti-sigma regulatory factor (Ser/Thr protein kinase)